MRSFGFLAFCAWMVIGIGSLSFAGTAPGGITPDMTVREAGQKAATMSSKEIQASIDYLKAMSLKAGAVEKANIKALIAKLERKKKSREGEEKAKADSARILGLANSAAAMDDEEMSVAGPNATPTATPAKVSAAPSNGESAAYASRLNPKDLMPSVVKHNAFRMSKEELMEAIVNLNKAKETVYDPMNTTKPMIDRAVSIYQMHLDMKTKK